MKLEILARILIQLSVMVGDIIIMGAVIFMFYIAPLNPLVWILSALLFWVWHKQRGFMAWNPRNIKMFIRGDD